MKKLWCLFRRRSADGENKICIAKQESEGRVFTCKYATEEDACKNCPDYAVNNRHEGEEEGIE